MNKSVLKPPESGSAAQLKLISTPSIPLPERFYYDQNPDLLESKLAQLDSTVEMSKTQAMLNQTRQGGAKTSLQSFTNFKRVSSLDHIRHLSEKAKVDGASQTQDEKANKAEQSTGTLFVNSELQKIWHGGKDSKPGPMDYQPLNSKSMVAQNLETKQRVHNNHQGAWI